MTPASTSPSTAAQVLDAPETNTPSTPAQGASKTLPNTPAKAPEPDTAIAGKLSLVHQREAAAIRREQQAAQREAAQATRDQELTAREAKMKEFETLKSTNPRKALELLGMSYQELTQVELNDGEVTPEIKLQRLEAKLNQSLEAGAAEKRQAAEAAQKQEEQKHAKVLEDFKDQIRAHTKANPSRYEFIEFEGEHDLVYDTINEHYTRTYKAAVEKAAGLEGVESLEEALRLASEAGVDVSECRGEIWTTAQGADKVEAHLEKKYLRAKELSKVKALSSQRTVTFRAEKPQTTPGQTQKTLSNDLSAAAPVRTAPRTDADRIRDAIAYHSALPRR